MYQNYNFQEENRLLTFKEPGTIPSAKLKACLKKKKKGKDILQNRTFYNMEGHSSFYRKME